MPSLLRSVFAVIFGYVVMIVTSIPMTLIAVKMFRMRSGQPTAAYFVYNVVANLFAAFIGGVVTGRIALEKRQRHGLVLGLLIGMMAAISYRHYAGPQPPWYQAMLIVLPPLFAVFGSQTVANQNVT
jgi:putative membrane protein (TIGR04086 family)